METQKLNADVYYLEYNDTCLCLIFYDLGTSTNSHPRLQFGCSNAEKCDKNLLTVTGTV